MANKIKESNITDGAVTSDKIAPGTINADRLAGSITGSKIAPATIDTPNIAPAAITGPLMGPAAVGAPNIAPGAITTTQISPSAGIVSSQIAPGTIANDRLANTGITINGTTIALGASGTIVAGTDWQSVITADGSTSTTAVAGEGYFIDTTSATHTINLPATPTQGDEVTIVDYAGTFGTNNVTVGRNGSNIDATASNATLATNRLNVRFVYIDSTKGWRAIFDDASENYGIVYVTATGGTVSTSGNFKTHIFTGDGCFVVSDAGNQTNQVDYLVVAGGGGGGSDRGAGGGAGGARLSGQHYCGASPIASPTALTVTATTYPITVGGGGLPGSEPTSSYNGTNGSNSVFSTITSAGGGGGGNANNNSNGDNGGSGGGGADDDGAGGTGGSGNTPPVSPSQGNPGGNAPSGGAGAGGGGATSSGASTTPSPKAGGPGGAGVYVPTDFLGPLAPSYGESGPAGRYFAGGGGGGSRDVPSGCAPASAGGLGGGGDGGTSVPGTTGTSGSNNTGGGAGGGGNSPISPASSGGKGIVILRYRYQ